MQPNQTRYTYENAGFSAFLLRSLKSNPGAQTVMGGISTGTGGPVVFDRQAIAGAIGDNLSVGRLKLQGDKGRIAVTDTSDSFETGWMGDLTN